MPALAYVRAGIDRLWFCAYCFRFLLSLRGFGIEWEMSGLGTSRGFVMEQLKTEISRVGRTHDQARKSYDRISRWYDLLEGSWEERPRRLGLEKLQGREGECILEIGFGTGHSLIPLARAVGAGGRVYGLDLSLEMLRIAQASIERAGLTSRVELCGGDAVELPFLDGFFDGILMSFVLELFDMPEIPQVLSECRRVLRNGGRITVVSLFKQDPPGRMQQLYEWGHRHFPQLLDCRPIPVHAMLQMAGLKVCQIVQQSLWGLPIEIVTAEKA